MRTDSTSTTLSKVTYIASDLLRIATPCLCMSRDSMGDMLPLARAQVNQDVLV